MVLIVDSQGVLVCWRTIFLLILGLHQKKDYITRKTFRIHIFLLAVSPILINPYPIVVGCP